MTKTVKISDIAEVRPGYLTREGVKTCTEGSHYILQLRDFNRERSSVNARELLRFNPDTRTSLKPLQPGEVVFLARGSNNFAYVVRDLPFPTLAAAYFFVLHPNGQVVPDYLAWYLNHPDALRILARSATSGAHMSVVRRPDIENLPVPVPPLAIQRSIGEVDGLMREEQTLLEELKQKKRDLFNKVCMTTARSGKTSGEQS